MNKFVRSLRQYALEVENGLIELCPSGRDFLANFLSSLKRLARPRAPPSVAVKPWASEHTEKILETTGRQGPGTRHLWELGLGNLEATARQDYYSVYLKGKGPFSLSIPHPITQETSKTYPS